MIDFLSAKEARVQSLAAYTSLDECLKKISRSMKWRIEGGYRDATTEYELVDEQGMKLSAKVLREKGYRVKFIKGEYGEQYIYVKW